ncbi:glycolate oxidase subunit GlcE [Undibacterium sp. LX40W]|uniref:Glycolate oxidase subunit GlcE n=2 Tax=Oxalobacteraceae TaxID=75682 RepID=A0A923HNZ4_9BURK|nr:glycolate oxidase subunit GlcE [Undibacterium nitidum]MBC3891916.1 glycolate oxidase subunit GlcE [Undibacterium sp. LX40W]
MKKDALDEVVEQYQAQIQHAIDNKSKLRIVGGDTKSWYGNVHREPEAETLHTTLYRGVIEYEPSELFIRVRGGTPLSEVQQLLAQHGQMFAFEPPSFGESATIGGMVASGLSGPRRAYAAAVKDHVLGVTMLNGRAEMLRFGSKVIKNVAGYDASRLMVGALGSLGLLLDVTLKVVPKPQAESNLVFAMSEVDALQKLNQWAGQPLPVSASCYHAGRLTVRLSGAAAAVQAAEQRLGGQIIRDDIDFWISVREQRHHFFIPDPDLCLWRLSLPSSAPALSLRGKSMIEWGGAQRWLWTHEDVSKVRDMARHLGGHATMFRYALSDTEVFTPLPQAIAKIEEGIRLAFDPHAVFQLKRTAGSQLG